uniref:Amphiregulin n=1 Tax=Pelusios castaneus TaxID=367368 RepID=A0A8C8RYH7_9SAUR
MRVLLLLSALAWLAGCQRVAELGQNAMDQEENVPVDGDHTVDGNTMSSEIDYEDMEEEEEEDPTTTLYIVDDSVRVEPVVKPKQTKTEREKNPDKTKRRKNKEKKNKKKKGTPCEAEYKNFCIHGECKYLENLKEVTCTCDKDYFGQRCGEQSMKSQKSNDTGNSTTILVLVAVLLSSISFIAIVIVVTIEIRKTCSQSEEKEERRKLRQENGNGHVGV